MLLKFRTGLSKCGDRLEALSRGPTQWRVQKFEVNSSHNCRNRWCERAKLEGMTPSFISQAETSTNNGVTPDKSMSHYTYYLNWEEVLDVKRLQIQS